MFRAHQLIADEIAQVPVIILSAAADLADAACTLAPAAALGKPFEVDHILDTVTSVLGTEIL